MGLSIPQAFANLVTATGQMIDTNFQYIVTMFHAANGFASLDVSARLVEPATTVFDGVGNRSASPTSGANIIPVAGAGGKLDVAFIPSFPAQSFVKVSEVQASGTNGGTSTATTWTTRTLNTKDVDSDAIATLNANQLTLPAGTYEFKAYSPFVATAGTRIKLRNITDSSDIVLGVSTLATGAAAAGSLAFVSGRFTIAGAKALAIQYWTVSGVATIGLGSPSSSGDNEVYTVAEFRKVV